MNLHINKKYTYLFFLFSLLISFYFGENSSGGSELDYVSSKTFTKVFSDGYIGGILYFINIGHDHFPFFYIFIYALERFTNSITVHFLYLLISSLIPLIFYNILKKKFTYVDKNILYLLSLILFFSPYLRSSAVWLTTDNLGIIFFGLAISKYLSFEKKSKNYFKYSLQCFLFLILASYTRQYYAVFFIIFLGLMFQKLRFKQIIIIIIFNFLVALPALVYIYFYISQNSLLSNNSYITDYLRPNIFFNVLVFLSLCFFYFLPFLFNTLNKEKFIALIDKKKINIFFIIIFFTFIFFYYDLPLSEFGGGIFYKISKIINIKLFYFFSFIGALFIFVILNINLRNLTIYSLMVFGFPVVFIYQKYYDPLIYFLFFGLVNADFIDESLLKNKFNFKLIYSYLIVFLLATNIYYII
jgi:hypothetical protein